MSYLIRWIDMDNRDAGQIEEVFTPVDNFDNPELAFTREMSANGVDVDAVQILKIL